MPLQLDTLEETDNPLDSVEEILADHNWIFNRMTEDELMVEVSGKACTYRLFFIWQEDMGAMQFCCQYDMKIRKNNQQAAGTALMKINENLWMGHFDIPEDTGIPSFRHTCLMRGIGALSGGEHIEDLVDISMAQCERYYNVFHMLAHSSRAANDQNLPFALMDTSGEA